MTAKFEINTQCDHATFFKELPEAIDNRVFEVEGSNVKVYDDDRIVNIKVADQTLKQIGSLRLPMEKLVFEFPEHTEEEANAFMNMYRTRSMRCGGG